MGHNQINDVEIHVLDLIFKVMGDLAD